MSAIKPIRRIGIVNRGEAAMRCIRSIKALRTSEGSDLEAIALYTEVDREAPFVRHADHAYRLPAATTPVAAYLDANSLIETLRRVEADAVWPGWGFIAESPDFADLLAGAGITFLGPSGDTMRRLGDKIASKQLAEQLGVPVTEWSGGTVKTEEEAKLWAERIGMPLLIKASAGGGGRGIRIVKDPSQVSSEFKTAASEVLATFGDDRLFMESMVIGGRHIEVQIVADRHGFVLALGCRDCSVQRRHQKVIEEAPPSGLPDDLLTRIKSCAVKLAREVGYTGVGTVEFLVCGDSFYFLEMNPRLQVEHGITEETTGLDLVEIQIRIARGEKLEGLRFSEQGYCIEARVCAEDPDRGFMPAPGRVVRFDPSLGPSLRIDAGVVTGTVVPPDFDSLIAKVMASGSTRRLARSRLITALRETDLVVEGGATNKGYLLELLDAPDFQAGGVDTAWLDRWNDDRTNPAPYSAEAFVLAAVLGYRKTRRSEQRNFFADTSTISPELVPSIEGCELDIEYRGNQYRASVYSVGPDNYRVDMDGHSVGVRFGETGNLTANIVISERYYRAVYDITESSIRIELEGYVHRFGRQTAGQVRAESPSVVVAVHVKQGDAVSTGQNLGMLEAMKMEIPFTSPIDGTVGEVRAVKGQQVVPGDLLMVIEASGESDVNAAAKERLGLPEEADPIALLFKAGPDGPLGESSMKTAELLPPEQCAKALAASAKEIQSIILGFDVSPARFDKLLELLEESISSGFSKPFLKKIAKMIKVGLIAFADVEQLFSRARTVEKHGGLGPSNNLQLHSYLRRMQAGGEGMAPSFLSKLRAALVHYNVQTLDYSEELEGALFRMFASQKDPACRLRLLMAMLRRLLDIAAAGVSLEEDVLLGVTLTRIASMREELSHSLADTALEALYLFYQSPEIERKNEDTSKRLMSWLETCKGDDNAPLPPKDVLEDLVLSPQPVFRDVDALLRADAHSHRALALSVLVRRFYAPRWPEEHSSVVTGDTWIGRFSLEGKFILIALCSPENAVSMLHSLAEEAGGCKTLALELIVELSSGTPVEEEADRIVDGFRGRIGFDRLTISFPESAGVMTHVSYERRDGQLSRLPLHGLHPETASRIDLPRFENFQLERLWGPENVYCFYATSRQDPGDQRLFVLGDIRERPTVEGEESEFYEQIFERALQQATRALRFNLGERDQRRSLHWNRIVIYMAHPMAMEIASVKRLSRRMSSSIRFLGIEKLIVRLKLKSRKRPKSASREIEIVGSDLALSRMELRWRRPHRKPLVSVSPYERKVTQVRRKGLVYPYEIIRMLASDDQGRERAVEDSGENRRKPRSVLPISTFEEFDIEEQNGSPVAVSVAGRQPGQNTSAIVFGIISTATDKIPEGMQRVLVLSDPTHGMGALGPDECDRVVAAIDLAERLKVPIEWVPLSSGARIAMDSGTENLDATARVVRRIVTFTQAGGIIHLIISGVNVGAQSYWDSLSTMMMHTGGVLIMTPNASMVLTGSAALAASGSIGADDEVTIGGHERVMGPNGQAQYFAQDLLSAFYILHRHYDYTYVVPGESGPRRNRSEDSIERDVCSFAYRAVPVYGKEHDYQQIDDVFDDDKNPGRKKPFAMRALMQALIDQDGGYLERWSGMAGAETAIVWDTQIGGYPACLLGIESQNIPRMGYRPLDGPEEWNGGTLFPLSSKKVARAINAASGNRPMVILANLSGFDGSPESMRNLQLEYGAEIARAVVNFRGTIVFLVVSRYHGGAYVVFSRELNPGLRASALEGSYASVIGGGPAATVVFPREVRARVASDPRIKKLRQQLQDSSSADARLEFDRLQHDLMIEKREEVAAEFDRIHSVDRARKVGSLEEIIPVKAMRPFIVDLLAGRS